MPLSPLSKKQRDRLWTGYVIGMVIYYELAMLVLGYTVTGFLVAFAGIGVITAGFVVYMRRRGRPVTPAPATLPPSPADAEPAPRGRPSS